MAEHYDKIIIGAGLYGLYSAEYCARRGERILVLECDDDAFKRATYINQARVHHGYHYPRSLSTAKKSAGYFRKFSQDYDFCINGKFKKIYATSSKYSWSNGEQFMDFCKASDIPCVPLHPESFFNPGMCDGIFETEEYTYDAMILRDYYKEKIEGLKSADIHFCEEVCSIRQEGKDYVVGTRKTGGRDEGTENIYKTGFVLNASYASTNQITSLLGFENFKIKYELCEIILTKANAALSPYGITVMDGPFFSVMPFGRTGLHSLTSVTFTPHSTSYEDCPTFDCQRNSEGYCTPNHLGNCNECISKPKSAYPYMASLSKKYLKEEFSFIYKESLFSMKPILMTSEIDDSRPTVIRKMSENPTFVSVLSGKINTVYDLDEVLD